MYKWQRVFGRLSRLFLKLHICTWMRSFNALISECVVLMHLFTNMNPEKYHLGPKRCLIIDSWTMWMLGVVTLYTAENLHIAYREPFYKCGSFIPTVLCPQIQLTLDPTNLRSSVVLLTTENIHTSTVDTCSSNLCCSRVNCIRYCFLGISLMPVKTHFIKTVMGMLSRFSRVRLFMTPWTVAHQAPLSMGLFRQEY